MCSVNRTLPKERWLGNYVERQEFDVAVAAVYEFGHSFGMCCIQELLSLSSRFYWEFVATFAWFPFSSDGNSGQPTGSLFLYAADDTLRGPPMHRPARTGSRRRRRLRVQHWRPSGLELGNDLLSPAQSIGTYVSLTSFAHARTLSLTSLPVSAIWIGLG